MFGDLTRAVWGDFQWGDVALQDFPYISIDGHTSKADDERSLEVDGLGLAIEDVTIDLDGNAIGTADVSCAVDAFTYRLVPGWADRVISPRLLVEMRLRSGTVRVSLNDITAAGYAWTGRLVSAGEILRTFSTGTDDMRIELDDTATRGDRFRDLFLAEPPEGCGVSVYLLLADDEASNLMHVWEGCIERVAGFGLSVVQLDVLRTEQVEDRLLGREVNETDWPTAPRESLGRVIPIVFGRVTTHEGVVVEALQRGSLAQVLFPNDLAMTLTNASDFPATGGRVVIDAEEILYATKTGNVLGPLFRGANGYLKIAMHQKGADVAQVGAFSVKLADHPLARIERVMILDGLGELGEPVPPPDTIDAATAMLTWSMIPRIRSPKAEPVYQRLGFAGPGPGNTAANPEKAARESSGYDALGYAGPGGTLQLDTATTDIGEPGDIVKVWLGVIFDPESIGGPDGARATLQSGIYYSLQPNDLVPDEVSRQDERTGDRLYEVTAETQILDLGTEEETLRPNEILHPGLWASETRARAIIDGDDDTYAAYIFVSVTEAAIVGSPAFRAKLNPGPTINGTATTCRLEFLAGWTQTPFTSPMTAKLVKRGAAGDFTPIPGTEVVASTLGPVGQYLGLIRGIELFSITFPATLLGASGQLEDLADIEWHIAPRLGVSAGIWVARELRMIVTVSKGTPDITPDLDVNRTVTNYFEIPMAGNGFASQSVAQILTGTVNWGWFTDTARGGRVSIVPQGSALPRILEVFWLIKHLPFTTAQSAAPRVFADVVGMVPAGSPPDIMDQVIQGAPPLGMGLGVERIDRPSYIAAAQSLAADSAEHQLGFAVQDRTSAVALLGALAEQGDLRQAWDTGRHRIARKARADTLTAVRMTLTMEVIRGLSIARTGIGDVRSRITGRFGFYQPTRQLAGAHEEVDAAAETTFGRLDEARDLTLVQDQGPAELLITRDLERRRTPRWVVDLELPPMGLELRGGDLVAIEHRDFTCRVAEVQAVTLDTSGFLRLKVRATVWLV